MTKVYGDFSDLPPVCCGDRYVWQQISGNSLGRPVSFWGQVHEAASWDEMLAQINEHEDADPSAWHADANDPTVWYGDHPGDLPATILLCWYPEHQKWGVTTEF